MTTTPTPVWTDTRRWTPLELVVTRRLARSWSSLEAVLSGAHWTSPGNVVPLRTGGALHLDGGFGLDGTGLLPGWRAGGRLVGRSRLWGRHRVDTEITPWSDGAIELRITPRSRHVHLWGTRRQRRYSHLAHDAGDRLAELLD